MEIETSGWQLRFPHVLALNRAGQPILPSGKAEVAWGRLAPPFSRLRRTSGRGVGGEGARIRSAARHRSQLQRLLLSPALSSTPSGREGVGMHCTGDRLGTRPTASFSPRLRRRSGRGAGGEGALIRLAGAASFQFQRLLLSPALSSTPSGREGVRMGPHR